ncbi:MAG: site-2 protease family protein [Gammaproteobacteria bacterium]|nr:site-2 protease family protein [Gammaproteobacteria bacterium]
MTSAQTLSGVQLALIWLAPVLLAVTMHEVAHGWMADRLGDSTARDEGRLSLNPLRHIDPIGTILVPAVALLASGVVFGWAKPVPITWTRLGSPRRDVAFVALAGPAANLVMAVLWTVLVHVVLLNHQTLGGAARPLVFMGVAGIAVNVFVMVLNLLPLPPLDGGRITTSLLPQSLRRHFARIEPFGLVILVVLLVTGVLTKILIPLTNWLQFALIPLAGIRVPDYYWVLHTLTGS